MATKKPSSSRLEKIRNIGIIAHIDAGKTTLTERILYYTQKIHRMGEVHEGTATMDFLPEEQERGITIASAFTSCLWRDKIINIIDTPGHVDFTVEVDRALRVLDGAVAVFCAVGGVEPQSETVWRQSTKYHIPKLAFINKMDRPGADFEAVLDAMQNKLGAVPLPVQVPLGEGEDFKAVLDVISGQKLVFENHSLGRTIDRLQPDSQELELAAKWRSILVEALADHDDQIMEDFLDGQDIPAEKLLSTIRTLCLELKGVPVLSGTALKNIGVQPLMDAICEFLPSPWDVPQVQGLDPATHKSRSFPVQSSAPLSALVFKVSMETGRKLVFLRIYSGTIKAGDTVYNSAQGVQERAARLFTVHAKHREKLEKAGAGEIVAAAGMKDARTGDTICSQKEPIILEKISDYVPVISLALEPRNSQEEDKLTFALDRMLQEDPTLFFERDQETDQIIISGMGELHLDVVLHRMRREYGVDFRAGNPQVVHQETISEKARANGEFARELGEEFHYGWVEVQLEPRSRGQGNRISLEVDYESWSQTWLDAAHEGVEDALQAGEIQGFPITDVHVRVKRLKSEKGADSIGFRLAAVQAVKNAMKQAGPVMLEPIMNLEINTPADFVGECINLLGAKSARVENMFDRGEQKIIHSLAPLRNMFGFSTDLRSATQGRAGFTMKFHSFDAMDS